MKRLREVQMQQYKGKLFSDQDIGNRAKVLLKRAVITASDLAQLSCRLLLTFSILLTI
ncbi:hypothetical protein L3C95_22670 [Chitinophaga filiformis]|nr:hypothetical protein [Chitinophaga filiformis]